MLKNKFGIGEDKACYYFQQIIYAVEYIHQHNISHRDLKLENILFADKSNKEIKLIDFGLSNIFKPEDKILHTPCGSPCYAPPEVYI